MSVDKFDDLLHRVGPRIAHSAHPVEQFLWIKLGPPLRFLFAHNYRLNSALFDLGLTCYMSFWQHKSKVTELPQLIQIKKQTKKHVLSSTVKLSTTQQKTTNKQQQKNN